MTNAARARDFPAAAGKSNTAITGLAQLPCQVNHPPAMPLASRTHPPRQLTRSVRTNLKRLRSIPQWDGSSLVPWQQIQDYCDAIAREFHPERIVLFGSYAGGKPTPHSDVDLFIVLKGGKHSRDLSRALAIRRKITAPFAVDLVVRKPEFVAERLAEGDMFITGIMRDGKVMYESQHA